MAGYNRGCMNTRPDPATTSDAPGLTSLSLLDRAKANDPAAWQRLTLLYGPLVYQWCRRWQLGPEDAADVAQEVFQTLAKHLANFLPRGEGPGVRAGGFRGWLWTITRNKITDHFRKASRQPHATGGSDAQVRLQALPEQLSEDDVETASDSADLVHRALDLIKGEFEERTWTMFWRSAALGHASRDIAAGFGVTPDAVRMAKSRVLRRLRDELADWEEH